MRRKRSNFEVELSIYANMTDNSYLTTGTVGETDLNIVKHQSHDVSRDSVSLHIYHTHFGTWELYMGCDFLMTFLIVDKINNLI
jgi:hypothetical protein